jgi:hypothetical protein
VDGIIADMPVPPQEATEAPQDDRKMLREPRHSCVGICRTLTQGGIKLSKAHGGHRESLLGFGGITGWKNRGNCAATGTHNKSTTAVMHLQGG